MMEPAPNPDSRPAPRSGLLRLAALGLLVLGAALHLWYLIDKCPLDLSGDEAHYWEWSRHLDWSYYSKGPLVAYIIAASRALLAAGSQRLVGSEALAVRLPAILLSLGTGLGLFQLAAQALRRPRLGLAAVALTFTIPILAVGAILMTIDAPLAFFYVWTLVLCEYGLRTGRLWPWLLAGLLIALGVLAKYTMVLIFPAVGLALLIERPYRPNLRRPGPYLALLIGLCGLLPIVIWNAQHGWVSFRHVAGQAGVAHKTTFDWAGPVDLIAGQAAVVGPVWFIALVWAVVGLWRRPQPAAPETHDVAPLKLLLYATVTPWAAFLVFSPLTKVQPNWPVLAVLPGTVLLVLWLARLLRDSAWRGWTRARGIIAAGTILGAATVLVMHRTDWLMPAFAYFARHEPPWNETPTAKYDPTVRLRGWSQLGTAVGRHWETERAAGRDPFIVTDDYQVASEIAFYCPGQPPTYCLQAVLGNRESQYDLWPNPIRNPERFVGRPCIYVGARKPELFGQGEWSHVVFRGARLAERVEHRVRDHVVQVWPIWLCDEYAGLPPELLSRLGQRY